MATINVTLPADGTTADVADYNTPINTIVNEFNGNIDNANIKTAAAISGSKLADNSIDLEAKASTDTGWREVTDSWAYASATTITVPTDATAKYSVGDKIRLTQSTVKYFYITAVTTTILTISGGTDYTLTNAAISDISYSKASTPVGFPQWFSWTATLTNMTLGNGSLASKFSMNGKTINFKFRFTLGSTSAMGTSPSISAPITLASPDPANAYIGTARLQGTDTCPGAVLHGSTTSIGFVTYDSNATFPRETAIAAASPFTWTTNHVLMCWGVVEAA